MPRVLTAQRTRTRSRSGWVTAIRSDACVRVVTLITNACELTAPFLRPQQDPLSSYNTLSGYLFNIQFLRRAFGPRFILHDLRQTGDHEITSRWTMLMSLQVITVQSTAFPRLQTLLVSLSSQVHER